MSKLEKLDPIDIIEHFLFSVIEQLPGDADEVARSLQRFIHLLENTIYRLKQQNENEARTIDRLRQQVDYLKQITIRSSDLATKSTVIEGILTKLRHIMATDDDE